MLSGSSIGQARCKYSVVVAVVTGGGGGSGGGAAAVIKMPRSAFD